MTSHTFQPVGNHYLLELFECLAERIDDEEFVNESLQLAANKARATVIEIASHRFQPNGVTAVALLKESHLSVHCWPESNYAAIDLFTCGSGGDPQAACDFLIEAFGSKRHSLQVIKRGHRESE